jgi:hypothetical protein
MKLTEEQGDYLYKMYLRGLVTFSEIVNRIYNSVMAYYLK